MLRVRDLAVRYGEVEAVSDLDLDLADGETLALLGQSGSGKTTVLLAIAGLVEPANGTIELDGVDLSGVATHRRRTGMVFQDFALFPHLDVGANVAYGLRMAGDPDPGRRVAEALEMVGLSGLEGRRIDQLSGGQAQRVALARTLAPRPRLLLLDEPLGSLDPDLRAEVALELAALLDATSIPAVVVTHDPSEAFALGDRIAVIIDGSIAVEGTPQEVWENPRSAEAARLLGHRNIVLCDVAGGVATLAGNQVRVAAEDGPATLLIKPEAISTPGAFEGPVSSCRFRGPDWIATVNLGIGSVEVPGTAATRRGQSISFGLDPAGVVVLD